MKSIVMLSSPPGAGKSTVARELVAAAEDSTVYIEGDTFWSFIAQGAPEQSRSKKFNMIMTSMTVAAVPYALADYEVILDFSIPLWFLDTAKAVVKMRAVPLDYVVLRPSETVCAARAASRTVGAINDYSPYREFYGDFAAPAPHIIQDDTTDAAALAGRIREGLQEGKFRVGGDRVAAGRVGI